MTVRKQATGRPSRTTTEPPGAFHAAVTNDPANHRYATARATSTSRKANRKGT